MFCARPEGKGMPFSVAGVLKPVSGDPSSAGVTSEAVLAGTSLICWVSVGSIGGNVAPIDSRCACSAAARSAFSALLRL